MHHNKGLYQQSLINARNISYCKRRGLATGVKYKFSAFKGGRERGSIC